MLFAKQLIHETRLPMAEIALASGFGSVRRFNETFRDLFRRPPSALRRQRRGARPEGSARERRDGAPALPAALRLAGMLASLAARATPGAEVEDDVYRRIAHDGKRGTVEVAHLPAAQSRAGDHPFPLVRALPAIVARIRRVFDLGADVATIGAIWRAIRCWRR